MKCPNCNCEVLSTESVCPYCGFDVYAFQRGIDVPPGATVRVPPQSQSQTTPSQEAGRRGPQSGPIRGGRQARSAEYLITRLGDRMQETSRILFILGLAILGAQALTILLLILTLIIK